MFNNVYVKTLQKGKDGSTWHNGIVSGATEGGYTTAADGSGHTIVATKGDLLFEIVRNEFFVWTGSMWEYLSRVGADLSDGVVTTSKLSDGAVTTAKLHDGSVTTDKLDDAAVTNAKLGDSAVTTVKLHDGSVTTDKLDDAAVTTAKLGDSAVTSAKLVAKNVTTAKLADKAVTSAKLGDGAVTTGKISDGAVTIAKLDPGFSHNSIGRGKSLGTSVTTAQWSAIESGEFTDLYIGDYWTFDSVKYRIAAFDYYGRNGVTDHHIVLIPDTALMPGSVMHYVSSNSNGYTGTDMYTTHIPAIIEAIRQSAGIDTSRILLHQLYLSSAVSQSGIVTALTAANVKGAPMTMANVFGWTPNNINTSDTDPIIADSDNTQFPLFHLFPSLIPTSIYRYWLRDPIDTQRFLVVTPDGIVQSQKASDDSSGTVPVGVRPAFCIYVPQSA